MTIHECLKELYEEEMDRVFRASGNYLMTIPKKGMEAQWEKHSERADILEQLCQQTAQSAGADGQTTFA